MRKLIVPVVRCDGLFIENPDVLEETGSHGETLTGEQLIFTAGMP